MKIRIIPVRTELKKRKFETPQSARKSSRKALNKIKSLRDLRVWAAANPTLKEGERRKVMSWIDEAIDRHGADADSAFARYAELVFKKR